MLECCGSVQPSYKICTAVFDMCMCIFYHIPTLGLKFHFNDGDPVNSDNCFAHVQLVHVHIYMYMYGYSHQVAMLESFYCESNPASHAHMETKGWILLKDGIEVNKTFFYLACLCKYNRNITSLI